MGVSTPIAFGLHAPSADFKRKNLVPIAGIANVAAMVEKPRDEFRWPVRKMHQD
jgi:hypothetical protein